MNIVNKNCEPCKYHYMADANRSRESFNALTDTYEVTTIYFKQSCCSFEISGVLRDPEQPKCIHYEETK